MVKTHTLTGAAQLVLLFKVIIIIHYGTIQTKGVLVKLGWGGTNKCYSIITSSDGNLTYFIRYSIIFSFHVQNRVRPTGGITQSRHSTPHTHPHYPCISHTTFQIAIGSTGIQERISKFSASHLPFFRMDLALDTVFRLHILEPSNKYRVQDPSSLHI